jgi:hypothetical protein
MMGRTISCALFCFLGRDGGGAALQEVDIYYFQAAIRSAVCFLLLTSLPHFYESFLLDLPSVSRAIGAGACRRNIAGAIAG